MSEKTRTFEANASPLPSVKLQARPSKDAEQLSGISSSTSLGSGHHPWRRAKVPIDIVLRLIDWFEGA